MKLSAKLLIAFIVIATVAALALSIAFAPDKADANTEQLSEKKFEQSIEALGMMENTWQEALPQTEIYNLISEHFNSPLPEGKTEKKAIVIGYDGCRVDCFGLLDSTHVSAINTLLDDGGQAVFSYCGGVNYPAEPTQKTSTAPGWSSMLTGKWAYTFGVTGNGQPKPIKPKSLLLSLVEDGTVDSSAFYVSWKGHFTRKNATYINEKDYIEKMGVNSVYLRAKNDKGTAENVIEDIKKADCSDFIFLTLEYIDHNGHATGFSLENPKYVEGFRSADSTGYTFIQAIKDRATYGSEDWLILITTDHGGIGKDHGGDSFEERMTFIVSNKGIIE